MDDEPLLPGVSSEGSRRSRGSFPAIAVAAIVVAAVVGLLGGAVWGLSGRGTTASPQVSPEPVLSPSPTVPVVPPPSSPPVTSPTAPTPPGDFPAAPAVSQQTSEQWHVGSWRITNTGGIIGMQATVTNQASQQRSGNLTMYLYVNGAPLARLTAAVTDVAAKSSLPVTFTSTDKWGPGTKTLLLVAA